MQLQCLIYYNRCYQTKQMAGVAIFVILNFLIINGVFVVCALVSYHY